MYKIHGMILIPQKNNSSCWYAAAQMLIQWKRTTSFSTFAKHPDPSQVSQIITWEAARNGLVNPLILKMATYLGLKSIAPMSPTMGLLEAYLRHQGPLWTNGKEHIVVIAGIDQAGGKVLVYDPWPPNKGKIEWRSIAGWYLGKTPPGLNDPDSSRDTGPNVKATFLYHP